MSEAKNESSDEVASFERLVMCDHAKKLISPAMPLIEQVLIKHQVAVLEEVNDEMKELRRALEQIRDLYDDERDTMYMAQAAYDMRCIAISALSA